jgi:hypothetical protein
VYTCSGNRYYLVLRKPTKIYGQGRGKTTLVGFGLRIDGGNEGNKSDGIVIEDLTIKGAEKNGLHVEYSVRSGGMEFSGMSVIMRGCSVEECQENGVFAERADVSCDDLQVVGCVHSGVVAYEKATITLSGQGTTIQRNCQWSNKRGGGGGYGLYARCWSSSIHLVHPLTKERISTNNGGYRWRNWYAGESGATIEQVSK